VIYTKKQQLGYNRQ